MASPLQNRLVGTIILVALAVIILPDVLDGEKAETVEEFETIPLQPEQEVALQEPQPVPEETRARLQQNDAENDESELEKTADTAQPINNDDSAATLQAPPREPKEFAADGEAYVIQLGAFSNADSVNKLVVQLRDKGYAAYSERSGRLTKLMVGPDTSKAELEKQLPALTKLTGLNGKVLSYKP
ncbi:SPOR domain-containing protein [Idiomarina sp. OT37-5b]|uniref:SPOR domain-containing protein n=1 Tax=Idiomarina sp. OT37-5b TaxID=2100422 RepID=UPI000CF8AFCE|nr:SPOR domain-containing protein [Idiomarina sp. OT37-5b]AVJ55492.1 SPOR domain-containing protein [Idiomarina sp. OT37-5b]